MIVFEFFAAIFISILDKLFGNPQQTQRYIVESNKIMEQNRIVCNQVARSTNKIWQQSAISTSLFAEEMKNDNIRRLKKIRDERIRLLNCP